MSSLKEAVQNLHHHYEHVELNTIDSLMACYAENATFRDPFQEVHTRQEIRAIFIKMYDQLAEPKFIIKSSLSENNSAFFMWEFHFCFKRWNKSPKSFTGVSFLKFDEQFLVCNHQDFWDPAAGIYEHLPVIGALIRSLKRLA